MAYSLGDRVFKRELTRRDFIWLSSLAGAGVVAGCAVNPVTGKRQFMLMTEEDEIKLDKENSPHQFSADYGALQEKSINEYITQVGKSLAAKSHRPKMPYSFRGVNATYINAYAFPGGSIAATRGILLEMDSEAELAGLLGHEAGHVNARHTAHRMSKAMITQAVVVGLVIGVAASKYRDYTPIAAGLGGIGAGALLAKYSRDDERQADALGIEYMTRAGYSPQGMVGLMDVLRKMSKHKPNVIERMFASHPMSDKRYKTALEAAQGKYKVFLNQPMHKERYMDHMKPLRRIKEAIHHIQNGERNMLEKKFNEAAQEFKYALKQVPNDYAGLMMMAKCQLALSKNGEAKRFATQAHRSYPSEPQALHIRGMANLAMKKDHAALNDFNEYEKRLPGNPNTIFFQGLCFEHMQRKKPAAEKYKRYLDLVSSGDQAKHAYDKLVAWGYIKPEDQQKK